MATSQSGFHSLPPESQVSQRPRWGAGTNAVQSLPALQAVSLKVAPKMETVRQSVSFTEEGGARSLLLRGQQVVVLTSSQWLPPNSLMQIRKGINKAE